MVVVQLDYYSFSRVEEVQAVYMVALLTNFQNIWNVEFEGDNKGIIDSLVLDTNYPFWHLSIHDVVKVFHLYL